MRQTLAVCLTHRIREQFQGVLFFAIREHKYTANLFGTISFYIVASIVNGKEYGFVRKFPGLQEVHPGRRTWGLISGTVPEIPGWLASTNM